MQDRDPVVNNSDLTEVHRSEIVKILQQKEVCSRAEIAKITGLTQASITKIVGNLIDMGIISESGLIKGNGNRRAIGVKLNSDRYRVIGVKFGRHLIIAGVFDISGKLYEQREIEFDLAQDAKVVIGSMKAQIHTLLEEFDNIVAIGVALPGPYLRSEGRIAMVTRMPVWHDVNFLEELKDEFDKPVFIEQDANAGALAEYWFGNHGRPLHTLAYFLVGEGVGSGIVDNGNLLLGEQGAASEIGHISIDCHGPRCECGNYGCLELYASVPVLLKKAKQEVPELFTNDPRHRIEECGRIFEAARSGNIRASALVEEMAKYIGYGCVTLINAYNPDIIVIGDMMAMGGDLLLPEIKKTAKERTIAELFDNTVIKMSALTIDPVLYGAAAIATDRVLARPSEYLQTI